MEINVERIANIIKNVKGIVFQEISHPMLKTMSNDKIVNRVLYENKLRFLIENTRTSEKKIDHIEKQTFIHSLLSFRNKRGIEIANSIIESITDIIEITNIYFKPEGISFHMIIRNMLPF